MIVETTKYSKKLTLKHPLILIVLCNLLFTVILFAMFIIPDLLIGNYILLALPFFTFISSYWSIYSYLNCRDYSFLDDSETIHSKGNYSQNSGIQLVIASYVVSSIFLLLTLLAFGGLVCEKYFDL